jgi:hypothetical protein
MLARIMKSKSNRLLPLMIVGLAGWLVAGGGYFLLGQRKRAAIVCVTIFVTFFLGLYVGSVGVIDPVEAKLWYALQIMFSPAVALLGYIAAGGGFTVYGRCGEIGQIYTSIAGLLNLLCIVNSVYAAHLVLIRTAKD